MSPLVVLWTSVAALLAGIWCSAYAAVRAMDRRRSPRVYRRASVNGAARGDGHRGPHPNREPRDDR